MTASQLPMTFPAESFPVEVRPVVNIAAYRFAQLENLAEFRQRLKSVCAAWQLKGSILLSPEGINLFIAGSREAIDALLAELRSHPDLTDLEVKESLSREQPFERMLVKIKPEIISFGIEGIDPLQRTSQRVTASELREWIASGKPFTLLDVRNNYEVRIGTFENAVPVNVDHFRDFPAAVSQLPEELRHRPVVTFCTGGIRCEKAAPFLEQAGFSDVYQLHGGILKYFEEVGGEHFQGECFVFDKRVAVDAELHETATTQCYACLMPLSVADQSSPLYDPPHACPHCHATPEEQSRRQLEQRHSALRRVTSPLPGSVPYDNARPLNVPARFAGLPLLEFLNRYHSHMGPDYWQGECAAGRLRQAGQPLDVARIVKPGEQLVHLQPATVEPAVNADIQILYEDDWLVVVNKPAPLPTHPGGRFHRNSLQWMLNDVYRPLKLKPAHRLDANTTGLVVLCKTRTTSAHLRAQFDAGKVRKTYLARVFGTFPPNVTVCEAPISREPIACGGRAIDPQGLPSRTRFEILRSAENEATLLRVQPETGRTNQIRLHLWHLGHPVMGDPLYLPGGQFGSGQTLELGKEMCLHASRIEFQHPHTGEVVTFEAPAPEWGMEFIN